MTSNLVNLNSTVESLELKVVLEEVGKPKSYSGWQAAL